MLALQTLPSFNSPPLPWPFIPFLYRSLWMVTSDVVGGGSGSNFYSNTLAVSTVNMDTYVFRRKPPFVVSFTNNEI